MDSRSTPALLLADHLGESDESRRATAANALEHPGSDPRGRLFDSRPARCERRCVGRSDAGSQRSRCDLAWSKTRRDGSDGIAPHRDGRNRFGNFRFRSRAALEVGEPSRRETSGTVRVAVAGAYQRRTWFVAMSEWPSSSRPVHDADEFSWRRGTLGNSLRDVLGRGDAGTVAGGDGPKQEDVGRKIFRVGANFSPYCDMT